MTARMINHSGARIIDRNALIGIPVPEATDTWHPVAHDVYLDTVETLVRSAGFAIRQTRLSLADGTLGSRERGRAGVPIPGARLFGVLDLNLPLGGDGASLAVGIRNSLDQSFAMGFCAGSRVFVCDNLSFTAELLVSRKHTRFGLDRLREAVSGAVGRLESFRLAESEAIRRMQATQLDRPAEDTIIVRAYENGILGARDLPAVLLCRTDPGAMVRESDPERAERIRAEFERRNAWSLYNAFTSALGDRAVSQPHRHAAQTMALRGLFAEVISPIGLDDPTLAPGPLETYRDLDDSPVAPNGWDFVD